MNTVLSLPVEWYHEYSTIPSRCRSCRVRGAVLVTTPQLLSVDDVAKEFTFCKRAQIPVIGVVENMAGYACPNCKVITLWNISTEIYQA